MYVSSMPPYYAGPLKRALLRMGAGNIAQTIPEENYLSYSVLNYLKKLKAQAKTEYDRTCNEVALKVKSSETKRTITSFKNPFDIPRHQLLDQIARLRTLFLRPSKTSVLQHGKPSWGRYDSLTLYEKISYLFFIYICYYI